MSLSMSEPGGDAAGPGDPRDGPAGKASGTGAPQAAPVASPEELRTVRTNLAAATATLPIAPEMAWAVPQLLKRVRLVSPGELTTTGVLRALIRMPALDGQLADAFAGSGFLACDAVMARARWKYDIDEMMATERTSGADPVHQHCTALLEQDRTRRPVDWAAARLQLQTLASWFPDLRTIGLLEQLYTRLQLLHTKSVLVARFWLTWRGREVPRSAGAARPADGSRPGGDAPGANGESSNPEPAAKDDAQPAKGLNVLVVDDNFDAALTLSLLLELEGHRTRTAHNGWEAVQEAIRTRYDAVLLDLGMPVMDGFEAAAILGQLQPAPVLIACSSWDDGPSRRSTSDVGFAMHLCKPVHLETLREVLRHVGLAPRPDSP